MQWIPLQGEHVQELLKQKTSSQEGHDMNNALVVVGKEGYLGDLFKRMDPGKSLHASSVGNPVTLHEIVDRSGMAIKAPHTPIQGNSTETNQ
jgi:hypothetical protein